MRTGTGPLLVACAVAALVVWTAAVVGVLYMVGVISSPLIGASAPAPAIERLPETDRPGEDLPNLPRLPGSVRVEYADRLEGRFIVTEVEYLADADFEDARAHFRSALRTHGWTITSGAYGLGEWVYTATSPTAGTALVEIEPNGRFVEIEIEIERPAA